MTNWTFVDGYGARYPALAASILSLLVFSNHTIDGNAFTGTLDVAASGPVLGTLGSVVGMTGIAVTGTVDDANGVLKVNLTTGTSPAFTQGFAASIPVIGGQVTKSAALSIQTVVSSADPEPTVDEIDLDAVIAVGSHEVDISCQVPMNGGFFTITGVFSGVGVSLDDLKFLMGDPSWFPSSQLGPYAADGPKLELLSVGVTLYVGSPFSVVLSSVFVSVGITKIPLMGEALYLNPLAVVATFNTASPVVWGVAGSIVLCHYENPDPDHPDFEFDFALEVTEFSLSAQMENPSGKPVSLMLQDLLGSGTDTGIPAQLTVDKFELAAQADKTSGSLTSFSADIAMSGRFGLFSTFDVEEFAISVAYSS